MLELPRAPAANAEKNTGQGFVAPNASHRMGTGAIQASHHASPRPKEKYNPIARSAAQVMTTTESSRDRGQKL